MQEVWRAEHPSHFDGGGVMRRDPRAERGDGGEGGKEKSAGEKETVQGVARRAGRRQDRDEGFAHVAAPSTTRGSSQPTIKSVISDTTMKSVAMARMPACTMG